jgi:hypothetical protein
MSNEPTPETESWSGWGIGGLQVVPASFARKLERERDELKRWTSVNGVIDLQRERDEAREQRDRLAEALRKLADCDWVITLPDRMDAVRTIAREALQSLTPNEL